MLHVQQKNMYETIKLFFKHEYEWISQVFALTDASDVHLSLPATADKKRDIYY